MVHAHGSPAVIDDDVQLLAHLNELTDRQEHDERVPWHVTDAPAEFIANTARRIVGLSIPITQIFGKWKVSQNRSPADRAGAAANLRLREDGASRQMADLVDELTRQP